jgi:hypothetical protein
MANNGGVANSADWALGSIGINGIFRSVWTVGRLADGARALFSSKSSLTGSQPTYLFDIVDERVEWLGSSREITAKQLSGAGATVGRPRTERERAKSLITELLRNCEIPSDELLNAALASGISERTYKAARSELGVVSRQDGFRGRFYSSLSTECKNSTECKKSDGQESA